MTSKSKTSKFIRTLNSKMIILCELIVILILLAGAFWKPIRKLLNPSFNLKILQSFVPIFNDKTNIMLEKLDKEAGNPCFDLSQYMHACTLDMVCGKCKMGSQLERIKQHISFRFNDRFFFSFLLSFDL